MLEEFRGLVYERYFQVVSTALKQADPNHLYLGCRFSYLGKSYRGGKALSEPILHAAGRWCDIVSINYYFAWEPDAEVIRDWIVWSEKPFMISEWYAMSVDSGLQCVTGAGFKVPGQTERGRFYQNFALWLLECPWCAGFHWFMYMDNDPGDANAEASNRNGNKGIVTINYTRERVTEENMDTNRKSDGEVARTPIKEQMKDLVSNKYWLLSQVIILVGMITVQMQGTNIRTNYCQWVLGANAENNLQIMYMAVAMAPMGFGIALIFPLVKKLGARKLVMAGGLISAICGLFCMLFPTNIGVAFAGSFIFSFGMNVIHQKLDFYAFNVYNSNNYNDGPDRINPLVYPGQPRTAMGWPITPEVMYWADLC